MATTYVPQLHTVLSLQEIDNFHLGSVREHEANGRLVTEGDYVNYCTPTPERRPFRFHIDRGADLKRLEPLVRARINANESLLDIVLHV